VTKPSMRFAIQNAIALKRLNVSTDMYYILYVGQKRPLRIVVRLDILPQNRE
jgi:hypothetical protein